MKVSLLAEKIQNGALNGVFAELYGEDKVERQRERYYTTARSFESTYGDLDAYLFSVPGRTEIIGNHTDHNNGKVICGAVDIDIISVAAKTENGVIALKSDGYRESVISVDKISAENIKPGSSAALIAGVADSFLKNGRNAGGFCAYTRSDVIMGSGISSSAAFEVMIGEILSTFYNGGAVPPIELAKAGQYAENVFFGKPCGLMDQAACAVGGLSYIDFADPSVPYVEKLEFDCAAAGRSLCLVNTGGSHAKLTDQYASLPAEMKSVAKHFGKPVLRMVQKDAFFAAIPELRAELGDRAVLRAIHYFEENTRVEKQRSAVKAHDYEEFFRIQAESGDSSFKFLQNVYCLDNVTEQGISLALALCAVRGITARVHGGGFAGTVQAWPKPEERETLKRDMESVFGEGCCLFLNIRPYGAINLEKTFENRY